MRIRLALVIAIVVPPRSSTPVTPESPSQIIEVSGVGTTAATAVTGSPWSRASTTSGSYEIARSTRPAATWRIGAEGSEGTTVSTSSPASSK